jgi:hypothetical protein
MEGQLLLSENVVYVNIPTYMLSKMGWANVGAIFLTKSSVHPAATCQRF